MLSTSQHVLSSCCCNRKNVLLPSSWVVVQLTCSCAARNSSCTCLAGPEAEMKSMSICLVANCDLRTTTVWLLNSMAVAHRSRCLGQRWLPYITSASSYSKQALQPVQRHRDIPAQLFIRTFYCSPLGWYLVKLRTHTRWVLYQHC
jgi:hypothetical protein